MGVGEIKVLREKTGAGMMDCKAALLESNGDIEKAVDFLRRKGLAAAGKKSGRHTKEGCISSYIHGGRVGVLIEVNCETDFVARNPEFQTFVRDLAMQVAGANPVPRYVREGDIPKEVLEKEESIFMDQARALKKPEEIAIKVSKGKLRKFIQEVCLLSQPFIKDPDMTIQELVSGKIAKMGENIQICRFVRYQLGEEES
ncbi:MAG: translation elongation factor Ts [Nitrospiria bacterium]